MISVADETKRAAVGSSLLNVCDESDAILNLAPLNADDLFFNNKAFYQVTNVFKGLDTPEQRLSEDVEKVRYTAVRCIQSHCSPIFCPCNIRVLAFFPCPLRCASCA